MNRCRRKKLGVTLIEMTLVLGTIVLLIGFGIPAVRALVNSFHSESGVASLVNAALSSARAMAVQRQSYVGVRFQTTCAETANADEVLKAPQYAVFIIHDPEAAPEGTGYANGFRALEGIEPIKLPEAFAVMDLTVVDRTVAGNGSVDISELPMDASIDAVDESVFAERLRETTAFSIVFSPSGKLIIHEVRVWNRQGRRPSDATQSLDEVFNTPAQRANSGVRAMFGQDEVTVGAGLGPEYSRTNFVICDRAKLREAYRRGIPWSGCLQSLSARRVYVSPYTGALLFSESR